MPKIFDKPLWQKLGIRNNQIVLIKSISQYKPLNYLDEYPGSIRLISKHQKGIDFIHLFVDSYAKLSKEIKIAIKYVDKNGMIWISWPKNSSKLKTDVSDNKIRDLMLPLGLADTKICSVSKDVWSGLKIVWRKENR